jgi:hypothetical protein
LGFDLQGCAGKASAGVQGPVSANRCGADSGVYMAKSTAGRSIPIRWLKCAIFGPSA